MSEQGFIDAWTRLQKVQNRDDLQVGDMVNEFLAIGRDYFQLDYAIVSKINPELDEYEVVYINAVDDSIAPGAKFPYQDTFCLHTINADQSLSFYDAQTEIPKHPCYQAFKLNSYIGTRILYSDGSIGTVNFSSASSKDGPFTENDHKFVEFLAHWLRERFHIDSHIQSITELKSLLEDSGDQSAYQLINIDSLTGLANISLFEEELNKACARSKRHNYGFALFIIELLDFEEVNKSFGDEIGDDLLENFAIAVKDTIRQNDYVARLSGNQFAVLAEKISEQDGATSLIQKLRQKITDIAGEFQLKFAVGVTFCPGDSVEGQDLLYFAQKEVKKAVDKPEMISYYEK